MTTLYKHIIARNGLSARTLRNWKQYGLPAHVVRSLSVQGRLFIHEGAWVLEWDGSEWAVEDALAERIRAMQAKAAATELLKKSIEKELNARTMRLAAGTLKKEKQTS